MEITTLIVDDELLARERIKKRLDKLQNFNILDQASHGEDAIDKIKRFEPDLIFLDIKLKDMTGFQVLNNVDLKHEAKVIFVTAYDNYAVNAFDILAFDFILKPFENQRFENSLQRVISYFEIQRSFQIKQGYEVGQIPLFNNHEFHIKAFNKLSYTVGNKIKFISFLKIKYILASGSYCEVYIDSDKKIVLRNSLNNIINFLDPFKFIRVHRSTIINIDFLDEIICSSYQETDVKMLDNRTFRVSKSKRKDIMKKLGVA